MLEAVKFTSEILNENKLKVLRIDPNNGVAQAYYGYLIKLDGELEQGVLFMRKGLRAARAAIADPRCDIQLCRLRLTYV